MRALTSKLKPSGGYSPFFHVGLNVLLPLIMLAFVRADLPEVAASLVIVSKWRMFSVKARHWLAIIQANAVDIIAGLSFAAFMFNAGSDSQMQLFWAFMYIIWLVVIKPGATIFKTSVQAIIAQAIGVNALLILFPDSSLVVLMVLVWLVAFSAARHFFTAFEEDHTQAYAYGFGYAAAAFTWILGHWVLFYSAIAQLSVLLTVISFSVGSMYYLSHNDKLSLLLRRQLLLILSAVLVVIVVFSDWSEKVR